MNVLGIESSCDETAAAIVDHNLKVHSQVVSSQIKLHRVTHGVVPEIAARAHSEKILPVIEECLQKSTLTLNDIDTLAVTQGPGLITSLLVGLETAKALSFATATPLVAVNHIEGHIMANLLDRKTNKNLRFNKKRLPIIVLTVSGGHTELLLLKKLGDYKLLGRTRDDAAGEAFDKVAKLLDLPYPGGPDIAKLAARGNAARFDFPRPMQNSPDYDFSFAGLKTAVRQTVEGISRPGLARLKKDIAASFQQAVIDSLLGKTARALVSKRAQEFWLVGGVAANQELRRQARSLARKTHVKMKIPSFGFCTDNAVMIAAVGVLRAHAKKYSRLATLEADPNLDLVSVFR